MLFKKLVCAANRRVQCTFCAPVQPLIYAKLLADHEPYCPVSALVYSFDGLILGE